MFGERTATRRGSPSERQSRAEWTMDDISAGDTIFVDGREQRVERVRATAITTEDDWVGTGDFSRIELPGQNPAPALDPLGFERQRPSGRFAPANVQPDPSVEADRNPNTGRFVSRDRAPVENIGRRRDSGLFDLF